MKKDANIYSIGQVARAAGLSAKAIRYYELIGLIPNAARRASAGRAHGSRFYKEADIGRLRFIRKARQMDLGLAEVRELLAIAETGCPSRQPLYADVLRRHVSSIDERINRLLELRSEVRRLLGHTRTAGGACCTWETCGCMHAETPARTVEPDSRRGV